MCIVTRVVKDEQELVRFVRSPDGEVVPDLHRKLPGRGVWVSLERAKVVEAQKRNLFARGFGAQSNSSSELADRVGRLLRQQAVASLSLARKAGQALASSAKVDEALRKGPVAVLLHVASAAEDGMRKLDRLAQPETLVFKHFRGDELDLAFGRANVVHAAVAQGGLGDTLITHIRRIAAYEGLDIHKQAGSDSKI
jgi:predicted RNA-binding protein YlxR (DUF448 family)